MANLQDIIDGAETKRPAKKVSKNKLSFTTGVTPEVKSPSQKLKEAVNTVVEEKQSVKKPIVKEKQSKASNIVPLSESISLDTTGAILDVLVTEESIKGDLYPAVKLVDDGILVDVEAIGFDRSSLPVEELKLPTTSTHVSKEHDNIQKAKAFAATQPKVAKPFSKSPYPKASGREIAPTAGEYPDHFVQIALVVKNNAEIRRFTSLGILNYLLQKGEIKGKSKFVSFKWNKFVVKVDNLAKEYSYTEPFFINCFVASFASFAASAQKTIETFINEEKVEV